MYISLRRIDKLTHSAAISRILRDHENIPGFKRSSVYRALPSDDPLIPRRVVQRWDKSSNTKQNNVKNISTTNASNLQDVQTEPNRNKISDNPSGNSRTPLTNEDILEGKYDIFEVPKQKLGTLIEAGDKCKVKFYLFFEPLDGKFHHAGSDN